MSLHPFYMYRQMGSLLHAARSAQPGESKEASHLIAVSKDQASSLEKAFFMAMLAEKRTLSRSFPVASFA